MGPNTSTNFQNHSQTMKGSRKLHENIRKRGDNFSEPLLIKPVDLPDCTFAITGWHCDLFIEMQKISDRSSLRENFRTCSQNFISLLQTWLDLFGPILVRSELTRSGAFGSISRHASRRAADAFKKMQFLFAFELVFDGFGRSFTKNFCHDTIRRIQIVLITL